MAFLSRALTTTALLLALPVTASAQNNGPSLWDLLKPEYLVQRMLQAGIMALRTQADIKYGALGVNLLIGQASISDISIWPLVNFDDSGTCRIEADRLVVRAAPIDRPDLVRIKAQATGVSMPPACLPPDQRQIFEMTGLEEVFVPRLTLDLEYDIAQAEADVHLYGEVSDFAALDLTADLSYLALDGRDTMENPKPVVYLRAAALTAENLGGWEAMKGLLPPPFTDPTQAPAVVGGMVGQLLGQMNRSATGDGAEGDPSALNDAQSAFLNSLTAALPAFLENPRKIVLETGYDPSDDVFIAYEAYESDPRQMFADLQPIVSLAAAPARATLAADLVSQALGDGSGDLDAEDRARVGIALVTGIGAPRNVARGLTLLEPLATAGNGEAAMAMARALDIRSPEDSYRFALMAGAAEEPGAAVHLDRLESRLPFARVIELQNDVVGDVQHPLGALQRVALMREQAAQRLSGIGQVRSYPIAALWAILAKAAGDSEGADILEQIDERVRMSDDTGRAAWADAEEAAANLAMDAWIGQDLPGRFNTTP